MGGHWRAWRVVAVLAAVCACRVPAAAQPPADIQSLVARVGERVAEYYRRAQSLVCLEKSIVQPIDWHFSPDGMARTVESELHLELAASDGDSEPDIDVVRKILRINGRAPRKSDKNDRAGCTDPDLLSSAPLDFLLPAHRGEYRFTSVHGSKQDGRAALIIDFTSTGGTSKPELFGDAGGHDDCYDWTGSLGVQGTVWVDAGTYDVLRVDRHVMGPVSIRVPWKLQRESGLDRWVVLDRDDLTLHYKPLTFENPDEVLLLPSSADELTVLREGLQSMRRTVTYSDYRRFLTDARIVKDGR